jgi:hypothetical protein
MAKFPDLTGDGEVTQADILKGRGVKAAKKGGLMKKKMKHYENGGSIDDDVRARAMKFVEGLEGIKGSDIEDETGTVKGSIKRNEYGDLYDSEMKAKPKAEPKPKPKAEPKKKTSSFEGRTSPFAGKTSSFKKMASGGSVSSASKRADGCAIKGKTRGKMV